MRASDIIEKSNLGDTVYVVKPMLIRWNSMRFEHTSIVCAKYVVVLPKDVGFWGNTDNMLKAIDLPDGTKNYPSYISSSDKEYQCFYTPEEAEVWKVLELQDLEHQVDEHIATLKEKTKKKIKQLKQKEKFDEYLEKYPDKFLKVM